MKVGVVGLGHNGQRHGCEPLSCRLTDGLRVLAGAAERPAKR